MNDIDEQNGQSVVLAVASQKGGVGKTTTALNLGYALARRGWRTLVADADPQGAIGLSLRRKGGMSGQGWVDCLEQKSSVKDVAMRTRLAEFDILTFGGDSSAQLWQPIEGLFGKESLRAFFDEAKQHYDVILVDTAGGTYGPTLAVLRECDSVLFPLQAEPLALRSVTQILDVIGLLRKEGSHITIAGFLLTMLSPEDPVSMSVAQECWKLLPAELILNANVPRDNAFLRASVHGVPVGLLSRRPPRVAAVFDLVAHEIERRIGLVKLEEPDEPIPLLD